MLLFQETNASSTNHTKYRRSSQPFLELKIDGISLSNSVNTKAFGSVKIMLQGIMSAQEQFKAQPTDIFICSHPKSGTTWLKALSFAILTRNVFLSSTNPLLSELPHDVVPFIETLSFTDITSRDPELPLLSTHMPYTSLPKSVVECKCKIIYICRDPKDSFVSMWHFAGKLRGTRQKPFHWRRHVRNFVKDSIMVALTGIMFWVIGKQAFNFLRECSSSNMKICKMTPSPMSGEWQSSWVALSPWKKRQGLVQKVVDLCSFEILSNLEVNKSKKHSSSLRHIWKVEKNAFFRKGKVGDWENYLTADMAATIDQITEQKFSGSGLSFKAP
ncbi:hypothetical protein GH714_007248 [Hevea brasiliensis]|uniref:Sulfotransferase n=1 Tax=Hevea brasiliensis TaxID=3981 RepID=A0A6A6KHM4_HEVBR|nr:hypothetical protein GH714_007248 [Hevea brasiliensis]